MPKQAPRLFAMRVRGLIHPGTASSVPCKVFPTFCTGVKLTGRDEALVRRRARYVSKPDIRQDTVRQLGACENGPVGGGVV
jgi:hypothetical protein